MIGIYLITNITNGKVYVGQSTNIELRWKAHRTKPFNPNANDYQKPLYRAIRKYGLENFTFQVIEICSIEELNDKEQYWIQRYSSNNTENGYNLTAGGESGVPHKLTESQVDEIIQLLLNSSVSQEEIANKFNISQRLVSGINLGEYWIKEKLSYPLRKKQQHICLRCGQKISPQSNYCITCSSFDRRKVDRPNRELLKSLIRTTSFTNIGKQYGVSDNAVRKWCISEKLPTKKSEIKLYTNEQWENI